MLSGDLELTQKTQIAALQQANIVNAITHHGQTRQPQPERESAPFFRVNVAHAQHIRMHQTAWQQLHPAAVLANRAARAIANQAANIQFETLARRTENSRAASAPLHRV